MSIRRNMADQQDELARPPWPSTSSMPSSAERKRRDPEPSGKETKRRRECPEGRRGQLRHDIDALPAPVVAGPSAVCPASAQDDKLDRLSVLLTGIMDKLDKKQGADESAASTSDFVGFHDISSSEYEDGECSENVTVPLD